MKIKEVEITASVSAVIPTGNYENFKPLYSVKQLVEVEEGDQAFVPRIMEEMRSFVQSKLDQDYERMKIERIKNTRKDLRFYERAGKQYPSVTSIINAIEPISYDPLLLMQYASRGSIVHAQAAWYLKKGIWEDDVLKIPGTKLDYLVVTQGSLKLSWQDCNFRGWWEDNAKDIKLSHDAAGDSEVTVYNDEYMFAGTADLICTYKGKKAVVDFKTASNYDAEKVDKYWRQVAAYATTVGAEVMLIAPLNPKNKSGYGKTLVEEDVKKYFTAFLQDRAAFKQIYGV